jgi:hypothetical protein
VADEKQPSGEKSAEYKAFEALTRRLVAVPKKELRPKKRKKRG